MLLSPSCCQVSCLCVFAHLLENSRHRVGAGAPRDGTNKEMCLGERPLTGGTAVDPSLEPAPAPLARALSRPRWFSPGRLLLCFPPH